MDHLGPDDVMGESLPGIVGPDDTIVAVATPLGQGAISLIRISGAAALEVLAEVFYPASGESAADSVDRKAVLGTLKNATGGVVDEVLVT
ncbi:MAG: hypothetical protein GXP30_14150, partial [Verrucomicrobia bacterium]|nr:hypothetical protein [Verrucomicrobiota bacterium]